MIYFMENPSEKMDDWGKLYEFVFFSPNPSGTWLSFISESNIAAKTSEAAASTAWDSRWRLE